MSTRTRLAASALLAATLSLAALLSSPLAHASDSIPGGPQTRPVVITDATVHPVSGPTLEHASVLFTDGKLTKIGTGVAVPAGAETIDGKGKHVYPGLIQADGQLGLIEIDALRASRDTSETGVFNPNARAERAVNPDSDLLPVARANGILVSITSPVGGQIAGLGAAIRLDGWTTEDLTLKPSTGLYVSWPNISSGARARRGRGGPPPGGPGSGGPNSGQNESDPLKQLRQLFADARAYRDARTADATTPFDSRWEAMLTVLAGDTPIVVSTDAAEQMASAVAFCQKEKLKLIIVGGYEADRIAPLLKDAKVPVVLNGTHRTPRNRMDAFDAPYTLPARLRDAGVTFAIASDRDQTFVRNLPYHAATAASHGLTRDEALRAITLSPAEIFGISPQVGSLEPGKEATLFIADGDILDTPTHVVAAWTRGRVVDLSSRQTRLWHKYTEKYAQQKVAPAQP